MSENETRRPSEGSDAVGFPTSYDTTSPTTPRRYADEESILIAARAVAESTLGPNAEATDRGTGPNPANFCALAEAGLLGLTLPAQYGGLDAAGTTQREVTETFASYCGVTTFIQAQHHGPSRMILNGPNEQLKSTLLPDLASGRKMCAISFAHLRRPGPPVLRATPVASGYRLDGVNPWVTGWGLMRQVVMGATLPDGRFVYIWVPDNRDEFPDLFADVTPPEDDWGTLHASAPLPLCAMNASATVELRCENLFVPQAHWLFESDRETMQRNDRNGVLGATSMPIGCAAGSVRLLSKTAERRNMPAIRRTASAFQHEWETVRAEIYGWTGPNTEPEQ